MPGLSDSPGGVFELPEIMNAASPMSDLKRALVRRYAQSSDGRGLVQTMTTLLPLVVLWSASPGALALSPWCAVLLVPALALFHLRVFALLHDCGHGSLFRTDRWNRVAGFIFGVVSGMPQYVWSRHHDFHHRTNGDWERYRGPLETLAVAEYAALSAGQQAGYRRVRQLFMAPLAGFVYLIVNPRYTWLKGSLALARHLLLGIRANPRRPWRELVGSFQPRYWKTWREYAHMSANNVVLLTAWVLLAPVLGVLPFVALYVASVSLAGGAGILLFTVQHNFEHSYASTTADWSLDRGALEGTSFLVLPAWLNWFTADIGYHHVHHLSSAIPNYRLRAAHAEFAHRFTSVRRIHLRELGAALRCILWDPQAQRIIPVAEYELRRATPR
jgi:acyl-lipid omega-6 desaturase (Delta-12 desaturase)